MKKKWTQADIEKLKTAYSKMGQEKKSSVFFDKLAKMMASERSVAAIAEECRRLGLRPKRIEKTGYCESCLTGLTEDIKRVGNMCYKCYAKEWAMVNK
jgi:hypothetical protein